MIIYKVLEIDHISVLLEHIPLGSLVRDTQDDPFVFKPLKEFSSLALGPEIERKINKNLKTLPFIRSVCPWCAWRIVRVGIVNKKLIHSCSRCGWWTYSYEIGSPRAREFIKELDHARMIKNVLTRKEIKVYRKTEHRYEASPHSLVSKESSTGFGMVSYPV